MIRQIPFCGTGSISYHCGCEAEEIPHPDRVQHLFIDEGEEQELLVFSCTSTGSIQFEDITVWNKSDALVVTSVSKQCCFASDVTPEKRLGVGDVIVAIEGVSRATNLSSEIQISREASVMRESLDKARQRCETISLRVQRRPAAFAVDIPRRPIDLGMHVRPNKMKNANALSIVELKATGLIPSWNTMNVYRMLLAGDKIVEIDGITENAELMLMAIRTPADNPAAQKGAMHLKVERAPDTEETGCLALCGPQYVNTSAVCCYYS